MITASKIERITACPASEALPHVNSTSVFAERGIAIHEYLAKARSYGREKALAAVPEAWRPVCDAIDLDALPTMLLGEATYAYDPSTGKARWIGNGLNRDYSAVREGEMVGTADVVGVGDGPVAYVADWKTGYGDVTPAARNPQLRFLALCVSLAYPDVDTVVVEIIRIREDGSAYRDTATLDALDLAQIAGEVGKLPALVQIAKSTVAAGGVPNVNEGQHCRWCPAWQSCPAKTQLLKLAGSGDIAAPFMSGLTRNTVGAAFVLAENLRSLARELDKRVAAAVEELGPCETPRGTTIKKVLTEGNERIDPAALRAKVEASFGEAIANDCLEISATKKKLAEGLRKHLGRGGAQAEREILKELRDAGAVKRSASEKLVEVDDRKALAR